MRPAWQTVLAVCSLTACKAAPPSSSPRVDAAVRPDAIGDAERFEAAPGPALRLADFQPTTMLHVPAHEVKRARFPAIDFHQHTNDRVGEKGLSYPLADLLPAMDAANVSKLVILTGSPEEKELRRVIEAMVRPHPDRFVVFTQVDWSRFEEKDFSRRAVEGLRKAVAAGARGLKVLKELGLYVRGKDGRLAAVDDPRFDPIWRECGRLGIPVAIHTGDPEAFFTRTDRENERIEELWMNPTWSFHGRDFPKLPELLAARDRMVARHPHTTFVALHVGGWPENLDYVSDLLTRQPNVYVELGARQAELGRQPRRARQFFLDHQDRILFGTDFWPEARMYSSYFRWLETADEYFPYFNHPEQGRWHIYGLGLPDAVLEKVYHRNAERVLAGKRPERK